MFATASPISGRSKQSNGSLLGDLRGGGGMSVMASLIRVRPYAFSHRDPLAGQLPKVFAKLRIVVTEGC